MTNVTFKSNYSDGNGGGLQAQDGANLALTHVTFDTNVGFGYGGGALFKDATATLLDVKLVKNVSYDRGAGLYIWSSVVSVTDSLFDNNNGDLGGGIFVEECSPTLTGVTFNANKARAGAGLYDYYSSSGLTDVTFSGNNASENGGGMYSEGSNSVLTNVTFSGNVAGNLGRRHGQFWQRPKSSRMSPSSAISPAAISTVICNALAASAVGCISLSAACPRPPAFLSSPMSPSRGNRAEFAGGGMVNDDSTPALTNVTFNGNYTTGYIDNVFHALFGSLGGGMANYNGGNPTVTNVVFSGNTAKWGGAMVNDASSPTLTNATLSGNGAQYGGGFYNKENSAPLLQNTIVWGNRADEGATLDNEAGSTPTIRYSLVEGGLAGSADGGNNLLTDPLFARAVDCKTNGCGDGDDDYGNLHLPRGLARRGYRRQWGRPGRGGSRHGEHRRRGDRPQRQPACRRRFQPAAESRYGRV